MCCVVHLDFFFFLDKFVHLDYVIIFLIVLLIGCFFNFILGFDLDQIPSFYLLHFSSILQRVWVMVNFVKSRRS